LLLEGEIGRAIHRFNSVPAQKCVETEEQNGHQKGTKNGNF